MAGHSTVSTYSLIRLEAERRAYLASCDQKIAALERTVDSARTLAAAASTATGGSRDNMQSRATSGTGTASDPWVGWITGANASSSSVLYFPAGYYSAEGSTLDLNSGQTLVGDGPCSVIVHQESTSTPLVRIVAAHDVLITDIQLDGDDTSLQYGNIEIQGASSDIVIDRIISTNGYCGIWIKQGAGIRITNSHVTDCSHNIYIGDNSTGGGEIEDVIVSGCIIRDAPSGGDGIKAIKTCHNLVIDGNVITGNGNDGIDCFSSGDRVIISNNDIRENGVQGVDIKASADTHPVATYGMGREISIVGNRIADNAASGVSVYKTMGLAGTTGATSAAATRTFTCTGAAFESNGVLPGHTLLINDSGTTGDNGTYLITGVSGDTISIGVNWPAGGLSGLTYRVIDEPYNVLIQGNQISGNAYYGIINKAGGVSVIGNQIYENCTDTGTDYSAVYFLGIAGGVPAEDCVIANNVITNNGSASTSSVGINVNEVAGVVISGNLINNRPGQPNAYQRGGIHVDSPTSAVVVVGNVLGTGLTTTLTGAGTYIGKGNYPDSIDT